MDNNDLVLLQEAIVAVSSQHVLQ